ncbi:MAG: S41 family peptidase [Candidatus Hermodarchaeota archaeon]
MNNQTDKGSFENNTIENIIKELCEKIEKYYVFPKIAKKVTRSLLNKLEKGLYTGISDPINFERLISKDLVEISNDLHFYFEYDPNMAQNLIQEADEKKEQIEDDFIEYKIGLKSEQYRNFHILKAERLPGNIGYIKLNDFPPAEFAGETIIGALQFLANTNVLIFDIRNNGGGYPSMVALIISYLLEPNPKLLTSIYERKDDKIFQNWTLPYVPGKIFPEKPVYVLTSRRSASGAEEFAYALKMQKRATIIGETTRGAANPVNVFPILDKFVIWLPIGTPTNPISKDNWEGKGVSPDYNIPQEKALEKAHLLAFDDIINNLDDEEVLRMVKFELEYCKTFYNSIEVDLKKIKDFQGQYEQYKIGIKDNQAFIERANLKHQIITKDNIIYFTDETLKFWFEEENNKKILNIERRDLPKIFRLYRISESENK